MGTHIALTLAGGVFASAVFFFLCLRLTPLGPRVTALLTLFLSEVIFLGFAMWSWPGADVVAIHVAVFAVTAYVLGIIASQYRARRQGETQGWFHWAPASLVAFFALVLVADATFIVMAQSGIGQRLTSWMFPPPRDGGKVSSFFPGTVAHDYQEREAEYNAYVERMQRQQRLGWEVKKGWLAEPVVAEAARFQVQIRDRNGEPLRGARVSGIFMRPANSRLDQAFTMREVEAGLYQVEMRLTEPGRWDLKLDIVHGEDIYQMKGFTKVKPAS